MPDPGDLLETPGDIEFGGLLFATAPNTGGLWLDSNAEVDGLGLNETTSDVLDLPLGASFGPKRGVFREVTITALCVDDPDALRDLNQAMGRLAGVQPLLWLGHGHPGDEPLFVYALPVAAPRKSTAEDSAAELWPVDLRFWCADPRIYTVAEDDTTIDNTNPTVPNAGSELAPYRVVVAGPCTAPRVRNIDTERAIRFDDVDLLTGQTLTIDLRAFTAIVSEAEEDDVDVWPGATRDGGGVPRIEPLLIPPGGARIGFASEAGATSATLYSRDCYE